MKFEIKDFDEMKRELTKIYQDKINGGSWSCLDDFDINETLEVFCPDMAKETITYLRKKYGRGKLFNRIKRRNRQ